MKPRIHGYKITNLIDNFVQKYDFDGAKFYIIRISEERRIYWSKNK